MYLTCVRCTKEFDHPTFRGYCAECIQHFADVRAGVHRKQRPTPNVFADGKFADEKECPQSVADPVTGRPVCGLCGSDQLDSGYGLGSGYGMGTYTFCDGCETFLDFSEDRE